MEVGSDDSKVAICLAYAEASSRTQGGRNLLGVACEDGIVSIVDANVPARTLPAILEDGTPLAHWQAHRNLIHQLVWAKVCMVQDSSMPQAEV